MMILRNKIKIIFFTFGIVFLMTFSKTFSCTYVQTTHKTDNCCEYDKKINSNSLLDCIIQQCVIVENKNVYQILPPVKNLKN